MTQDVVDGDKAIPKWDVALAALLQEQFQNQGSPLYLADIQKLASEYSIRFDDIMDTLFRLAIHGEWRYIEANGQARSIAQEEVDQLYVNGRLHKDDLQDYTGGWRPVKPK